MYVKIITLRDHIRFAKTWIDWSGYRDSDRVLWYPKSSKMTFGELRKAMLALDYETCTVEDVEKVWGVSGNIRYPKCNLCEKEFDEVISIMDEDECAVSICKECLHHMNEYVTLLK